MEPQDPLIVARLTPNLLRLHCQIKVSYVIPGGSPVGEGDGGLTILGPIFRIFPF